MEHFDTTSPESRRRHYPGTTIGPCAGAGAWGLVATC